MSEEFSCNVCNFFVLLMIFYSIIKEFRVLFSELLIVYSNAIISKSLSMNVSDWFANLKELFIKLDCLLIFSSIIVKYPRWIIGSSFISTLSCSFTSKWKNLIIFKSFLSCKSIVRVFIAHVKLSRICSNFCFFS